MKPIRRLALIIIFFSMTGVFSTSWAAYLQTITTTSPWVNLPRPEDGPGWATAFDAEFGPLYSKVLGRPRMEWQRGFC